MLALTGPARLPYRSAQEPHLAADAEIVIVGGGFAGVSTAQSLKRLAPELKVTLIEFNSLYVPPPAINASLAGFRQLTDVVQSYEQLTALGVKVVHGWVAGIDRAAKKVYLSDRTSLQYDRLVLATGTALKWSALEGLTPTNSRNMPHAWGTGEQAFLLSRQLRELKNKAIVGMVLGAGESRCPALVAERVGSIARFLATRKSRSKLIVVSPHPLHDIPIEFRHLWSESYGFGSATSLIDWVSIDQSHEIRVDPDTKSLFVNNQAVIKGADLLSVVPTETSSRLAIASGLADETGWCPVDPLTQQSISTDEVYVVGDSTKKRRFAKTVDGAVIQAELCALSIASATDLGRSTSPPKEQRIQCAFLLNEHQGILQTDRFQFHRRTGYQPIPQKLSSRFRTVNAEEAFDWLDQAVVRSFGVA